MSSICGIEARFQIGSGGQVPLQTSGGATAQVSVEVLPEHPAHTVKSHRIDAGIQKTGNETVNRIALEMVLVLHT